MPELVNMLASRPHLARLTQLVTGTWPEHADYLEKSYAVRTPALLDTSDAVAKVILELAGDHADQAAQDYRWLCDVIREEEFNFARTDAYRYSTFEETNRHVYSDDEFMQRYMHGLMFSHVLWYMHLSSLHFFLGRLAARVKPGGKMMEVGSGHGLLIYLALTELGMSEAVAWDISPVSLDQTKAALGQLGMGDRARYAIQDMHNVEAGGEQFDLIILSHLLEHLEQPVDALQKIRNAVAKGGYLFVNVPLNAPMPDHIQLLTDPDDAVKMVEEGGFRVLEIASHTTQAATLPRALKRKTAVTCSIIAEPR
ncbi:class I SAM-dependent methyltransferase [uncultured Erythrobacter sp.]|uniref:class I SAM-dependent methyltransferase n=1 Tax=uncultured Erythrobacter sp. TaxID=263913 RepID=UPI002608D263|nr:class I SAM-dependent methyltransferase [uncultured Erythrobacter sp.]